jgi:hypothetical protein
MHKENPNSNIKYAVERIGSIRPVSELQVEEVRLRYHVATEESIHLTEDV